MSELHNPDRSFVRLSIEPYTPRIGAVVHDIDLSDGSEPELQDELRQALASYQVLFFRDQDLDAQQLIDVARIFGDPDRAKAFFPRFEESSPIELIESRVGAWRYGTDQWHADITFSSNPPIGTVLYAKVIPPSGGDTLWTSAAAAFDALPAQFQAYLETLEAVHSFEHSGWPRYFLSRPDGEAMYRKARADHLPVVHPVVRVHPTTQRKLLYVNPNFTDRIVGLSRQESDALLRQLFAVLERPDHQARLRWEPKTVAIWDNRSTQHYAVHDYSGSHRLLHRVTFGAERAF